MTQTTQLTDSDINPNCSVTNTSGKDVVILYAADSSTNAEKGSPELIYQETLTLMKLASGGTVLKAGSSDAVVLQGTYVNEQGQTASNYFWPLIFADPKTLAPVAYAKESPNFKLTPWAYPSVILTADNASQMTSAMKFTQTVNAFPSSTLAKNFTAAMQAASALPLNQMEAAIAQFFQGTTGFTNVTFYSYLVASTYISTFLPWWYPPKTSVPFNPKGTIAAHDECSYWLYSSTNMGGGNNGASSASCLARVMFLNGPTGDPSDHNCGIKVFFTTDCYALPSATGTQLYYDNGQLVEQITDTPQICLQTVWGLKSTFTGDITDTTLWPILCGTINGTKVIGVPMRPEDGWDKFADFWTGLTFQGVVNLFLEVMGVMMALDFIKTKLGAKEKGADETKANKNQGDDPTPEQEAQIDANAAKAEQSAETTNQNTADRMGTDPASGKPNVEVPTEANLPQAQTNVADETVKSNNNRAGDSAQATIEQTETTLSDLGEISNTSDIQEGMGNVMNAESNLPTATETGDFTSVKSDLSGAQTSIQNWEQNVGSEIANQATDTITEATTAQADFEAVEEESSKASDDTNSGDSPTEDGFDPVFPE